MKTIDCIKSRRSRRLFLDKPVPQEVIEEILQCAITAPSSHNCQPWHFIVVEDTEQQRKLADLKTEGNQQHILTAPVSIIVCVDTDKSPNSWVEDGVTATQTILFAVHELDLGSVYISGGSKTDPETTKVVRNVLELPENIIPITILPIGYPDPSEQLENKTLLDLKEVTHKDKW